LKNELTLLDRESPSGLTLVGLMGIPDLVWPRCWMGLSLRACLSWPEFIHKKKRPRQPGWVKPLEAQLPRVYFPCLMKLADYFFATKQSSCVMRRTLGVSSSTFRRWLTGERIPKPHVIQHMSDLTNGAVQLCDFLDRKPPKCASVFIDESGKTRIILPGNNRDKDLDSSLVAMRKESKEGDVFSVPLQTALDALGPRVRPHGNGMFLLDGNIADARMVVRAANRICRLRRQPLIRYPGVCDGGGE
jgi:hypothetical protein